MADLRGEPKELSVARFEEKIYILKGNLRKGNTRRLEIKYELQRLDDNDKALQEEIAKQEEHLRQLLAAE